MRPTDYPALVLVLCFLLLTLSVWVGAVRLRGHKELQGETREALLILVSAALRQRASGFLFRNVDRISPKGFAEAFEIYELRCERGGDEESHSELCRDWEGVYALLRAGPSAVAEQQLAAFLAKYPQDGVARYHQARLRGARPVSGAA